jgi:hypothetical protein
MIEEVLGLMGKGKSAVAVDEPMFDSCDTICASSALLSYCPVNLCHQHNSHFLFSLHTCEDQAMRAHGRDAGYHPLPRPGGRLPPIYPWCKRPASCSHDAGTEGGPQSTATVCTTTRGASQCGDVIIHARQRGTAFRSSSR